MAERFLKFIPSEEAMWLLKNKGHAFRLLAIIAESARRNEGNPDGLKIGECFIGGHENYDMTEQNYRTAKEILVKRQHIEIVETCRTRKKSTTGVTTVGTKVKLLSTSVWDINSNDGNDRNNDRLTTDQRQTRKNKKEKEKNHHPNPSSSNSASDSDPGLMTDDFLLKIEKIEIYPRIFLTRKELDECIRIKGSIESVKEAIAFIQQSEKRTGEITSWPNALAKWKIPIKKISIEQNLAFAEKLCKTFESDSGWSFRVYFDRLKDQKGILFENESPYRANESIFIAFADGKFREKCTEISKKLGKKYEHSSV